MSHLDQSEAWKSGICLSESLVSSQTWWQSFWWEEPTPCGEDARVAWHGINTIFYKNLFVVKSGFMDWNICACLCVFKCLFGNPSDADKRSESKINTKQIIFVYRGERSKDRSHTFSKISCLFETTQEEIIILIVWKIFPNIHEVFVDWIYDQTTGFIDIQQTSSPQWAVSAVFRFLLLLLT